MSSNGTNTATVIVLGILIPLIIVIALVIVAVICIMNRKQATTEKMENSNKVDNTTVEPTTTRSAETPSQECPVKIKIISIIPPPRVGDTPMLIPMMQPDDVSMMTEDHYSVWNKDINKNVDLVANQDSGITYNNFPIVTGSIVGGSVATTDLYYKQSSSTLNRNNKDVRHNSSNKPYIVDDDDDVVDL
jgi:hypothetical protein